MQTKSTSRYPASLIWTTAEQAGCEDCLQGKATLYSRLQLLGTELLEEEAVLNQKSDAAPGRNHLRHKGTTSNCY